MVTVLLLALYSFQNLLFLPAFLTHCLTNRRLPLRPPITTSTSTISSLHFQVDLGFQVGLDRQMASIIWHLSMASDGWHL